VATNLAGGGSSPAAKVYPGVSPVGREVPEDGRIVVGVPELIIVLAVVVLLFGSTQLPKLARSLGQAQKEFKKGQGEGATESDDDKR
jgi:sec-independent protein translocase protein TatA